MGRKQRGGLGLCPPAWLPGNGPLWGECPSLPHERPCFLLPPLRAMGDITLFTPAPSAPQTRVPGEEHAPVMWLRKLCRACVRREEIPRRHPRRGNRLIKVLLSGSLYSVIAKCQKSLQRKGYCGPGDFFQVLAVLPGPQTFRSPGLIPESGVGLRGRVGKAHIHRSPL